MTDLAGSIRRSLWSIRDHYAATLSTPKDKPEGGGGKKAKAAPLPLSAHIIDARAKCHADLLHYARAIQFSVLTIDGEQISTKLDGDNPMQVAGFIDTWAGRFATADPLEAQGCDRDMREHANALESIAMGMRVRRFPVGDCPEHATSDMGERIPCSGSLRAVLRFADDKTPSSVQCSDDQAHAWAVSEWLQLGRRVHGDSHRQVGQ